MSITLVVVAAVACGILDRLRGSEAHGTLRAIGTLIVGSILTMLAAGDYTPFAMVGAFLWWLGEKPGWGAPMGMYFGSKPKSNHDYEKWQITDKLKKDRRLAVAVRGLMWGLPMLVLYSWVPQVVIIPPAMAIAFVLACEIGSRIESWWITEFLRGLLCAVFVALMASQVHW